LHCHLVETASGLHAGVEVPVDWNPELLTGLQPLLGQRMCVSLVRYGKWPVDSMKIASKSLVALGFFEKRQHVSIGPTCATMLFPIVVILRASTHINHAVDGTA